MPHQHEPANLTLRVPNRGPVNIADLALAVRKSVQCAPGPFAAQIIEFCSALSAGLFKDSEARRSGELQSLAFFMRRASLEELQSRFDRLHTADSILAPRGVAFHIPPANVSSILAYSWLLSAVTGNVNIIRLPSTPTKEQNILVRIFNQVANECPGPMAGNTFIVEYGHEEEITAALSAMADIRVIWGGDATVNRLRAIPLPPGAKELTFADKHSLALISASHYGAASDNARDRLAAGFFNDTFWFDQMACSSPRLVIWHGEPSNSRALSEDFFVRLAKQINRRLYQSDLNVALTKEAFSFGAILDQGVSRYQRYSNELTVLTIDDLSRITRDHCGGGLLFQYFAADLEPVLTFVTRRDQTLSHFSYSGSQLADIARKLSRCGVDRLVPIGQALEFQSTWDGYDLLQEFSRRIVIRGSEQGSMMAEAMVGL